MTTRSRDKNQIKPPPSLDLNNWLTFIKENDILVDSLWNIPKRDNSGSLKDLNHGEFVAQIPRQAILRFTKPYDLVIDPFVGYGTTLIECQRLGRHGIGIEIEQHNSEVTRRRLAQESNNYNVKLKVIQNDSTKIDLQKILSENGFEKASLVVAHPPYHNIIKYGEKINNLCNSITIDDLLQSYGDVVDNVLKVLDKDGYYMLVIGDKYAKSEWIPLGFHMMSETLKRSLKLKSICIKNVEETIAKRRQINLWKYRTLKWGTHFFKHEYIMFFQKK